MTKRGRKNPGGAKGITPEPDTDEAVNALQSIFGQLAAENPVELRTPEKSIEDVTWNAVVMGHGNRFDDMPQVYGVAGIVASKLEGLKAFPAKASQYAPVVLAGMLNFLWRSQNVAFLAPEVAEGQAGTLRVAVDDLKRNWAPPTAKPWFSKLAEFPASIDKALELIDAQTYEGVYKVLEPQMKQLQAQALETFKHVQTKHKDATSTAMAFLMGTVIQKNTFSPLDGSVPEHIGEQLTRIYYALERQAEGAFLPWLGEGFKAVRERPIEGVQRWKMT